MDAKTLTEYTRWAEDNDVQVVLTIVEEIPENLDPDTIYIENGHFIPTE
jgi:hypothetical protein